MRKLMWLLPFIPALVYAGEPAKLGDLKAWLIGIGISAALAAAVRFFPKQKLIDIVSPVCFGAGKIVSKFMLLRLGKKAANSIEEGIFVTLSSVIYAAVDSFMKGLLEDNKEEEINKIKEDMRKNNPLFNIKLPK